MLYPEFNHNAIVNIKAVTALIGVHNGNKFSEVAKAAKKYGNKLLTVREVLEDLELVDYYKQKKMGSATKVAKSELYAVLKAPQMAVLVRNLLNAASQNPETNDKNTIKVRFIKKGQKVFAFLGSPTYSKSLADLDTPKGDEIPAFIEISDGISLDDEEEIIVEDKVSVKKQKPSRRHRNGKKVIPATV